MMNDQKDDKDLFRSLFSDIERVEHDRVPEYREKPRVKKPRPESRLENDPVGISPWPDIEHVPDQDTADYTYNAGGIQHNVLRRLRRGQLGIEASIDLHGLTRTQALQELHEFIHECMAQGMKNLQVVHGKGYKSVEGKPVLKPSVAAWLRQMPEVLAYAPCLSRDGGEGALYVLVKRGRGGDED